MSYFRFSIYKAIRKVSFLGILDQRSYKCLILNATELFKILDKFSFKEISTFSRISKLMHLDSKLLSSCLIKTLCKQTISWFQKCITVLILREQGLRNVLFWIPRKVFIFSHQKSVGTLCEIFSRQSKLDNGKISITICNCNETSNTVLLVQLLKGTCFRCRRLMAGKGRLHTFQASLQALDYGLISLVNELQDKFNEVTAKGGDDKVRDIQVIEVIDQYLQEATRGKKMISILSHVSLFPKSEFFLWFTQGGKKTNISVVRNNQKTLLGDQSQGVIFHWASTIFWYSRF